MDFKGEINYLRKKATKFLTSGLLDKRSVNLSDTSEIKRILITRPNHRLGNQLLITPLLKEVHEQFPDAHVDLFLKGNLGYMIFKNYEYVGDIICLPKSHFKKLGVYISCWIKLTFKTYDLVINAEASSSSGRLSTKIARAQHKFFGFERELNIISTADALHISKYPIYSLRYFLNQPLVAKPLPGLELKLSDAELTRGSSLIAPFINPDFSTICLYTYATGEKCFSSTWWQDLYEALQNQFPDCNIIEALPVENISAFDFKLHAFYSQNIRELASFIAQTTLFITGDCGIMHLAAATQTPTVGLFNVTSKEAYQPYNPGCLGIDTNQKLPKDICDTLKPHLEKIDFRIGS